jgi:predicted enzyme related to lactoylglutathione lyase
MLGKELSVAVMVKDGKKSAKWYEEKLGFKSEVESHWVTVWPEGVTWKLHLCEGELEPGNTGISLYTKDIDKAAAELKKKGVKFHRDVTRKEWGAFAQIEDPDGNIIWISEGGP